jgi:hypothetical protein
LASGAGGDGLQNASALPAAAATSFLAAVLVHCVAAAVASTAAQGAAAVGSVAIVTSQ